MLLVTNGSTVATRLKEDLYPATLLSWADILYEGPIPAGLDLPTLSEVRSFYLALETYGLLDQITNDFRTRDAVIASWHHHDEVALLFEHDLHDQLHIVQILDFLAQHPGLPETRVTLATINHYPGLDERFIGLGQLSAAQMRDILETRTEVTPDQLVLARQAWAAISDPNPLSVHRFCRNHDLSPLPYLREALERYLQELPKVRGGVSRTEWQILRVLAGGPRSKEEVFYRSQDLEDAPFQGDAPIFRAMRVLGGGPSPALRAERDYFVITDFGTKVLTGQADWLSVQPVNRWLGGVHLTPKNEWRWDDDGATPVKT